MDINARRSIRRRLVVPVARMGLFLGGLGILAAVVGVATGCQGSEEKPTPVASPVVSPAPTQAASPIPTTIAAGETRAELEELLRSMALSPEDLPTGFAPLGEEFTTNEEAAKDKEWLLARDVAMGRLLGYHRDYVRGLSLTATPHVSERLEFCGVSIELFDDRRGASEYMTAKEEGLSDPEQTAELGECRAISPVRIGDQALGFECTDRPSDATSETRSIYVFMRRGRGVAWLMMQGWPEGGWPSIDEMEAMLRTLDQRMKEVLEAPTAPPVATETASEESALPHISDAECAYLEEMGRQLVSIGGASEELVGLLNEPAYSDADWRAELSAQLDELYLAEQRARQLRPPESLADLNDDLRILASNWSNASELLRPLLDNQLVDSEAGQMIVESGQRLEAIGNKLSEFMATRSGTCD